MDLILYAQQLGIEDSNAYKDEARLVNSILKNRSLPSIKIITNNQEVVFTGNESKDLLMTKNPLALALYAQEIGIEKPSSNRKEDLVDAILASERNPSVLEGISLRKRRDLQRKIKGQRLLTGSVGTPSVVPEGVEPLRVNFGDEVYSFTGNETEDELKSIPNVPLILYAQELGIEDPRAFGDRNELIRVILGSNRNPDVVRGMNLAYRRKKRTGGRGLKGGCAKTGNKNCLCKKFIY